MPATLSPLQLLSAVVHLRARLHVSHFTKCTKNGDIDYDLIMHAASGVLITIVLFLCSTFVYEPPSLYRLISFLILQQKLLGVMTVSTMLCTEQLL